MKKIFSVLLCCALIASIAIFPAAGAADVNSKAGKVNTSSSSLNVRSGPGTSYGIVGSLKKGSYVVLLQKSGQWWKVEYSDGKYGYCSADYIGEISSTAGSVNITSGYLNVRSGAGTSYSVISTLTKNESVVIIGSSGTWYRILFDGTSLGYASASYIKETASAESTVKLSVPDFKQTDARWSGVYIGSSGKTIGSIGCTTTCLAMTESYRTGTTIYPDAMSKKLSYSSTGSLYWPENYTTDTSVTTDKIKSVLKQGKPVIVGLKTSAGSTHWVVVTGFSGSVIYINDPGSSSRTTLSQALEKYPYYYKSAYYG